jgi:transketolase
LRAMPNLWVMRPADPIETAECWALAIAREDGPSLLALSRQNVPTVRTSPDEANRSARGAYVLAEAEGRRRLTILATGTEVSIALKARERLQAFGVGCAVVSIPCFELFDRQDQAYRAEVLGSGVRIAVEAASPYGWPRYVGDESNVVGMTGFGASAPGAKLYEHFGMTADRVVELARRRLSG